MSSWGFMPHFPPRLSVLCSVAIGVAACATSPNAPDGTGPVSGEDGGVAGDAATGPNGNPSSASNDAATNGAEDGDEDGGDPGAATGDGGSGTVATLNGCTAADFAANDESASSATRQISFGGVTGQVVIRQAPAITPVAPSQYSPSCITISAGESVSWVGPFTNFPLGPSGGAAPTPITNVTSGTSASFTFPTAGTYGFDDPNAPTVMFGAVLVTP